MLAATMCCHPAIFYMTPDAMIHHFTIAVHTQYGHPLLLPNLQLPLYLDLHITHSYPCSIPTLSIATAMSFFFHGYHSSLLPPLLYLSQCILNSLAVVLPVFFTLHTTFLDCPLSGTLCPPSASHSINLLHKPPFSPLVQYVQPFTTLLCRCHQHWQRICTSGKVHVNSLASTTYFISFTYVLSFCIWNNTFFIDNSIYFTSFIIYDNVTKYTNEIL